jgi:hypothetical protein
VREVLMQPGITWCSQVQPFGPMWLPGTTLFYIGAEVLKHTRRSAATHIMFCLWASSMQE